MMNLIIFLKVQKFQFETVVKIFKCNCPSVGNNIKICCIIFCKKSLQIVRNQKLPAQVKMAPLHPQRDLVVS